MGVFAKPCMYVCVCVCTCLFTRLCVCVMHFELCLFSSPPAENEIHGFILPSQASCQSQFEMNVTEQAERGKKKSLLVIQKAVSEKLNK